MAASPQFVPQASPEPDGGFVARFGPFTFHSEKLDLRKHDAPLKLQTKPAQFLKALLERPGEIVPRSEIQTRLWEGETYVDFDAGINTALRRLRATLSDSAERPLYIETVARAGYRFIAPVERAPLNNPASPPVVVPDLAPSAAASTAPRPGLLVSAIALAAVATIGAAIYYATRPAPEAQFQPLTFRRGHVSGAQFAPDGRSILYSAAWGLDPKHIFLTNGLSPESRDLGFAGFGLIDVSRKGELLLSIAGGTMPIGGSDLYRVPMNGGEPTRAERNAMSGALHPDGASHAIARSVDGANILEFPPGRPRHRTTGWISDLSFSPDGTALAFIEHPFRHDDRGFVQALDLASGKLTRLGPDWSNAAGLAWRAGAREIWLSATRDHSPNSIWALARDGAAEPKLITRSAGSLTLEDISPVTGDALVTRTTRRLEAGGRLPGMTQDADLSWLDWSRIVEVSADGQHLLFDESGQAVANQNVSYLRNLTTGGVTRLGDARALSLHPDGKSALLLPIEKPDHFLIAPLDGSAPRATATFSLSIQWARYFPDGKSLLLSASKPNDGLRLYRAPIDASHPPIPLSHPTAVRNHALSPDATQVAFLDSKGKLFISPTNGAAPARAIDTPQPLAPLLWSKDGRTLYVHHATNYTEVPARVSRLDLVTGKLAPWKSFGPPDPLGVNLITRILLLDESGEHYLYSYRRVLSELYRISSVSR